MKRIDQTIYNVGFRKFQTEVTHADNHTEIRDFDDSNAVYPAFITLINALEQCENEPVYVVTNSYSLANEFNATHQNVNSRLLNRLKEKIAERSLDVTIEYVE